MKTKNLVSVFLALVLLLSVFAPAAYAEGIRPQDDYYTYVNEEWLATTELAPYQADQSVMGQAQDSINWMLMNHYEELLAGGGATGDSRMDTFLQFYEMAFDYDTRNAQGSAPLLAVFERIDAMETMEDLSANMADFILDGMNPPIKFEQVYDPYDRTRATYAANMPNLLLGLKEAYELENAEGESSLQTYTQTALSLLAAAGFDADEARAMTDEALAFDGLLYPLAYTIFEQQKQLVGAAGYELVQEPVHVFAQRSAAVDLKAIMTALAGQEPPNVYLYHPRYYDNLDTILTEENLPLIKSWMKVDFISTHAQYLDEEMRQIAAQTAMRQSGTTEAVPADQAAFSLVNKIYEDWNSYVYGSVFFTEEMRQTATEMVNNIIAVYWERLWANDWLSPETKDMAIRKLAAMKVYIGYNENPSQVLYDYAVTPVSEGGSLLSNAMAIQRAKNRQEFKSIIQPEEIPSAWSTPAHLVNASYAPWGNSFTIPASLFHPLLCNPEASDSWNYGMVGTIIGHEISHAFDSNGANYDENGNLNNWWTDADRAEFDLRTQAMIDLYEGYPFMGLPVSGEQTVNENIADAGGIACVTQLVSGMEGGNLAEVYAAFATLWAGKMTPEYATLVMAADVHAPGPVRVQVQCGNAQGFNDLYGVVEGDGMYIPPENRVVIW